MMLRFSLLLECVFVCAFGSTSSPDIDQVLSRLETQQSQLFTFVLVLLALVAVLLIAIIIFAIFYFCSGRKKSVKKDADKKESVPTVSVDPQSKVAQTADAQAKLEQSAEPPAKVQQPTAPVEPAARDTEINQSKAPPGRDERLLAGGQRPTIKYHLGTHGRQLELVVPMGVQTNSPDVISESETFLSVDSASAISQTSAKRRTEKPLYSAADQKP